jgi:Phage integrase family/Phage integrase SAM-like domain
MHRHPNVTVPSAPGWGRALSIDRADNTLVGATAGRAPAVVDLETAGRQFIAQRRALGRRKSTLEDYESTLRVHLVPFFGSCALAEIDIALVESFIYTKLEEGKAPKSIRNYLGLLHSILDHGVKRGWCPANPVALVEKPRADDDDRDIRFLSIAELEAILDVTPKTPLGRVDRLVFLTAAMTGMRRGEVVAVRWQDIDWNARLIRVSLLRAKESRGTPMRQTQPRQPARPNRQGAGGAPPAHRRNELEIGLYMRIPLLRARVVSDARMRRDDPATAEPPLTRGWVAPAASDP